MAQLEHVNITVSDAAATASWLAEAFGWHIRWQGEAMSGAGRTIHVGTDDAYVALYQPCDQTGRADSNYITTGGLNHVAVTVDDLDAADERVRAAGFEPHSHADYEPGRRFYFHDADGIEWEVVSYA